MSSSRIDLPAESTSIRLSSSSRPRCSGTPSASATKDSTKVRITHRRERYPPHTVGEGFRGVGDRLQREACLADAAGACEGQQANPSVEECAELVELVGTANEGGCWHRKVRPIEALQCGELAAAELEDALGSTEVPNRCSPRLVPSERDQSRRRRRDEHLAAVPRGGDASGAVDIVAHIPFLAEHGRARVDSDSHADLSVRGEVIREVGSRIEGARGGREGEEKGVSLRVEPRRRRFEYTPPGSPRGDRRAHPRTPLRRARSAATSSLRRR